MKRILKNNQYWYVCLCGFECSGSKDARNHNDICGASIPRNETGCITPGSHIKIGHGGINCSCPICVPAKQYQQLEGPLMGSAIYFKCDQCSHERCFHPNSGPCSIFKCDCKKFMDLKFKAAPPRYTQEQIDEFTDQAWEKNRI